MSTAPQTTLTAGELSAFARKLDAFTRSLAPQERVFFSQLLADAADAANEDVSGYINPDVADDDVVGFGMFDPAGQSSFGALAVYAEGVGRATA
ncbi:hypothetical protein QT616_22605, partial [Xanthomonas citri pv. citri]